MSQLNRQCNPELALVANPSRRIVLPTKRSQYKPLIGDRKAFRCYVNAMYRRYPELFPAHFREGYHLHDLRTSCKLPEVSIRQKNASGLPGGAQFRTTLYDRLCCQ